MKYTLTILSLFTYTLVAQADFARQSSFQDEVLREQAVDAVGEIWGLKLSADNWLQRNTYPEQWVVDGIEYHAVQSTLSATDLKNRIVDFLIAHEWPPEEQLRLTYLAYDSGAKWLLTELKELFLIQGSERYELLKNAYLGITIKPYDVSQETLKDLYQVYPDVAKYRRGRYLNQPRLFMFCRTDRKYPCMMLMRDKENNIVRNDDGKIWHQPSLGLSRESLAYNRFNGNTPTGVWRIDGVMPEANKKYLFGEHRRLKLAFVEKSADETQQKFLLPTSSHMQSWWRQSVIARDVGRGLFRIHGSGQRNDDVSLEYFPFVPTLGCVAQRENLYDGVRFTDQQQLLNQLMLSSGLEAQYQNETAIRALFYVIDISSEPAAVTLAELENLGLFE